MKKRELARDRQVLVFAVSKAVVETTNLNVVARKADSPVITSRHQILMSNQGIWRQNGPRKNNVDLKVNDHVWSVASTEDIPYGFITLFIIQ